MKNKSKCFIDKEISSAVEEHMKSLELMSYYPFQREGIDTYQIMGSLYNLKSLITRTHISKLYKNKTKWQLLAEIHQELNRALRYLIIENLDMQDMFHHQRMNALCYVQLLNNGYYVISKEYTEEEKSKYITEYIDIHYNKKYDDLEKFIKNVENQIDEYGIKKVIVKPLINHKNMLNYTLKEIRAIHFMIVCGEFENLC